MLRQARQQQHQPRQAVLPFTATVGRASIIVSPDGNNLSWEDETGDIVVILLPDSVVNSDGDHVGRSGLDEHGRRAYKRLVGAERESALHMAREAARQMQDALLKWTDPTGWTMYSA